MGHANPITRKGTNALKFNGRSLHELMVAFNQHEKGYLNSRDVPPEFTLANSFDFTKIKNAKIVAYFCGHRHTEDQYRINGIQYIFLIVRPLWDQTMRLLRNIISAGIDKWIMLMKQQATL